MRLELVPLDGEKVVAEEKQQWNEKRTHPIPPEILLQFNEEERKKIKKFLARLIVFTEQFDHDIKQAATMSEDQQVYYKKEIEKLNRNRQLLFLDPPQYLANFIQLLELCPMEPWHEFATLIKNLQKVEMQHYRKTQLNTGITAAVDNPFLLKTEDDIDEEHVELSMKCRITPHEIDSLIMNQPLETLVAMLIDARRINTGAIWDRGYYDL